MLLVNTSCLLAQRRRILNAGLALIADTQRRSSRKLLVLLTLIRIVKNVKSADLGLTNRCPAARQETVNAKLVLTVHLALIWSRNVLERKTQFAELAAVVLRAITFLNRALPRLILCAHPAPHVILELGKALLVIKIPILNALLAPPVLLDSTSLLLALLNETRNANLAVSLVVPARTNLLGARLLRIKTVFALLARSAVIKQWKLLPARTQLTDNAKIVRAARKELTRLHHAKALLTQIALLAANAARMSSWLLLAV